MAPPRALKGCWDKLKRAEHHLANLRDDIRSFEAGNEHTITVKVDPAAGKYSFYVHGLQVLNEEWGLVIGDCVHNARSVLDHLVGQLVSLATGVDPATLKSTAFPISTDSAKFHQSVAHALKDVPADCILAIEHLQPFNASNVSIWGSGNNRTPSILPGLLHRLTELDNIDKHRIIHPVWNRMEIVMTPPTLPAGFTLLFPVRVGSPLKSGAYIGEWNLLAPLPDPDWRPSEEEIKRYFPIHVALEDTLSGVPAYDHVGHLVNAVRAVLEIFGPVFDHGSPPLKVADVWQAVFDV